MGNKVNSTAFRLGINIFWKTELCIYKHSTLFKEFYFRYNFIKAAVRNGHWELLCFKLRLLKNDPNTIEIFSIVFPWEVQLNLAKKQKVFDEKRSKIPYIFNLFEGSFPYGPVLTSSLNKHFNVEIITRELGSEWILGYPYDKNSKKSDISVVKGIDHSWTSGIRYFMKHLRRNRRLRYFKFLEDSVKGTLSSLLFVKSDILSNLLSMLIRTHKKVKWILKKVRLCMASFHLFYKLNMSIRVSVCGKQKAVGRSRTFSFGFGSRWPMQSPTARVSYDLHQTWNVFGAFGVKVWIFDLQKTKKSKTLLNLKKEIVCKDA